MRTKTKGTKGRPVYARFANASRIRLPLHVVDEAAFRERTRRRHGFIVSLRAIKDLAESHGFNWRALVGDV